MENITKPTNRLPTGIIATILIFLFLLGGLIVHDFSVKKNNELNKRFEEISTKVEKIQNKIGDFSDNVPISDKINTLFKNQREMTNVLESQNEVTKKIDKLYNETKQIAISALKKAGNANTIAKATEKFAKKIKNKEEKQIQKIYITVPQKIKTQKGKNKGLNNSSLHKINELIVSTCVKHGISKDHPYATMPDSSLCKIDLNKLKKAYSDKKK
jgi:predicted RND superfamily exporter protein